MLFDASSFPSEALMTSEAFPSQAQTFLHRYSNLICFIVLLKRELGWICENKTLSNNEMS